MKGKTKRLLLFSIKTKICRPLIYFKLSRGFKQNDLLFNSNQLILERLIKAMPQSVIY